MVLQKPKGGRAVMQIIVGSQLPQCEPGAVVLFNNFDGAGLVSDFNRHTAGDEVEPVHRLVMLAYEIEALGGTNVIVEGNTGRNHIDEGRAVVRDCRLDDWNQLVFVAGEGTGDEACTELQRHRYQVDRVVSVNEPTFGLRSTIRRSRKLAFGQTINTIILHDINHVDTPPQTVRKLTKAYRGTVAVAGYAEIDQVAVRKIGAR